MLLGAVVDSEVLLGAPPAATADEPGTWRGSVLGDLSRDCDEAVRGRGGSEVAVPGATPSWSRGDGCEGERWCRAGLMVGVGAGRV